MTRKLVHVAFSGTREGALHRASRSHLVKCGSEIEEKFTGWLPADYLLALAEIGVLCERQGCFHPKAMAHLEAGELGKEVPDDA